MRQYISCARCGYTQIISTETHDAWEEINCPECGDFINTYGHWEESVSPSYLLQILSRSQALSRQMKHTNHH